MLKSMIYFLYNYVSVRVSAVPREAIRGQQTPLELELSAQCGCWELSLSPLKEQQALLTAEPSLPPKI